MSIKMTLLALGAALVVAPAASAATLVPYEPGGSPCAGACQYEWALEESGAPPGIPLPMTVPAGSISQWMSYAVDGEPLVDRRQLVLVRDQPAIGYEFERAGIRYIVARLDACLNWTVLIPPAVEPHAAPLWDIVNPPRPAIMTAAGRAGGGGVALASGGAGGGGMHFGGGSGGGHGHHHRPPADKPGPDTTIPSPVPVPGSGGLIIAAIAAAGIAPRLARKIRNV